MCKLNKNKQNQLQRLAQNARYILTAGNIKDDWTPLYNCKVEFVTDKAALINKTWWPVSQLAIDNEKTVYVKTWLYEKEVGKLINGKQGK